MHMTRRGAVCSLAVLVAAAGAHADLAELTFTGNNDVSGSFIIDLATPDSDPVDQDAGTYEDAFTISNLVFSNSAYTGGNNLDVTIDNDFFGTDQLSFHGDGGMWDGNTVAGFELLLQDVTGNSLSGDDLGQLLTGNLEPSDFANKQIFLLVDDSFTLESMIIDFSISEIPEPTSGITALVAAALLLGIRRRPRR